MAFTIQIRERDKTYLRTCHDLSPAWHERIFHRCIDELGNLPDSYRNDPRNRFAPGSRYFFYHLMIRDRDRMVTVRFIVDDTWAVNGILSVVFVDTRLGLALPPLP